MQPIEKSLLEFIYAFMLSRGYPPSQADAVDALGISRYQVQTTLKILEEKGFLRREYGSRALIVTQKAKAVLGVSDLLQIPIIGSIVAGLPLPTLQSGMDFISDDEANVVEIPRSLLSQSKSASSLYALEIQGESMIDALINDKDIVIMKHAVEAHNGEMVAIRLPERDETTLKYFFNEKDHYRLQPANPLMEPILIDKQEPIEIQGKVIMVIKRFFEEPQNKWRLDTAVPDHVQINKVFDLGILICPDTAPVINIDDLPKITSGRIRPDFDKTRSFVQLRVDVQSPECTIHGENPRVVRVYKDTYSPFFFQLTPNSIGVISIVVSVFQELDMLGNSRVQTVSLKKLGNIKIKVNSLALETSPIHYKNRVFISYAWGDKREKIVDELEDAFSERGIRIVRDKKDLNYRGSIKEFEHHIGQGQCVILIISNKYLKSSHCMHELVEIEENHNLRDRVFPIILDDACIYTPEGRIRYIRYWDDKIKRLNEQVKEVDVLTNINGITDDLNLFVRIRSQIDHLTTLLSDMNVLTPEIHSTSGFLSLIDAIETSLSDARKRRKS